MNPVPGVLRPPDGDGGGVEVTLHQPAADVRGVVERFWVLRWDAGGADARVQEALPHPCVNIAFEAHRGGVFGVPVRKVTRRLTGSGSVVGARLRPGALSALSATPACTLTGTSASLGDVLGEPGEALEEAVRHARDPARAVAEIEAYVRAHARPLGPQALLAAKATDALRSSRAGVTVAEVAHEHGVTPRTLQRVLRHHVGVTPKWVLQRARIHAAAGRLAGGGGEDLAALAAELGYADQAHFANDFRRHVGRAPGAYRGSAA